MRDDGARHALDAAAAARWCAPDMTAALAEHARTAAMTAGDDDALLAAAGWGLHGRAAIGEAVPAAIRALEVLGVSPPSGVVATAGPLMLGLAAAAREVGEYDAAWRLLRALLDGVGTPDELRADALIEAARLELTRGDGPLGELTDAAFRASRSCAGGAEIIRLGMIEAVLAAADRRSGRCTRAADRARAALAPLTSEDEPLPSAPHVAAALALELVRALIGNNQNEDALDAARGALAWPDRAATVERLGWLRLAIAGSTCEPIAEEESVIASLETAVRRCAAIEIPRVEAACHTRLAELYETRADLDKALAAVRSAHAAEQRYAGARERYRLQLARSAGVLADPLSMPPRAWDAGRDDRVPEVIDDHVDVAPDVEQAPEVQEVPDVQGTDDVAETPMPSGVDETPAPPLDDAALDDAALDDAPLDDAPLDDLPSGQPEDPATTPESDPGAAGHQARTARWEPGSVVLITVAATEVQLPVEAVREGLGKLRDSVEARLPLGARIVACAEDIVALLPGADPAGAEEAMRALCLELDEICPYLVDGLPDAVFHAVVVDHAGDPARLDALVRAMRTTGADTTGSDTNGADTTGADPEPQDAAAARRMGAAATGRHGRSGDADAQDAGAAPAAGSDTVVGLDKRETRPELSFAELLTGALAAYREA